MEVLDSHAHTLFNDTSEAGIGVVQVSLSQQLLSAALVRRQECPLSGAESIKDSNGVLPTRSIGLCYRNHPPVSRP